MSSLLSVNLRKKESSIKKRAQWLLDSCRVPSFSSVCYNPHNRLNLIQIIFYLLFFQIKLLAQL